MINLQLIYHTVHIPIIFNYRILTYLIIMYLSLKITMLYICIVIMQIRELSEKAVKFANSKRRHIKPLSYNCKQVIP